MSPSSTRLTPRSASDSPSAARMRRASARTAPVRRPGWRAEHRTVIAMRAAAGRLRGTRSAPLALLFPARLVAVVGGDDVLHQAVPDHVALGERAEADAID